MSNDSDFTLRFRHTSKRYLEQVQQYAEGKKARWDKFKASRKSLKVLMKQAGTCSPNEVVSWGFEFDEIVKCKNGYCLRARTWANQNVLNMHVTGESGELADLLSRFPEILIEGEFADEYGIGGVSQCGQQYGSYCRSTDGEDEFQLVVLKSSAIARAKYHPELERLVVELSSGLAYAYDRVPRAVIISLTKAKSAGRYYNLEIKGCYPEIKVGWD